MGYEIYNGDCFKIIKEFQKEKRQFDCVLTSPPYNTNKHNSKGRITLKEKDQESSFYPYIRYDMSGMDAISNEEYSLMTNDLFCDLEKVLKPNGVILYNLSYGAENSAGIWQTVGYLIEHSPFTVADTIIWKKQTALPNNMSANRLTRICEFIFVFCRKDEIKTFYMNKPIKSYRKTGQANYSNIQNFVEAPNNDESCPYNKATFSTDLCKWLLSLYCPLKGSVLDPFAGTGTTGVAAIELGMSSTLIELSENQSKWATDRLEKVALRSVSGEEENDETQGH